MKRLLLLAATFLLCQIIQAQTPQDAPLPEKLTTLPQEMLVNHFPSPVFATTDEDEPELYFWKHNTTVLSPTTDIQLEEFGAYIFYNQQWNLRVTHTPREFRKWFNCPDARLKKGQPYTFADNWRRDSRLLGGWALWYFIGTNEAGQKVCGYAKLDTVGERY